MCAVIEQNNITLFCFVYFCVTEMKLNLVQTKPSLNSLWKSLKLEIFKIQKTSLKVRHNVPSQNKIRKIRIGTKGSSKIKNQTTLMGVW